MDFHFLIRNAFSGAMLVGAFILGIWIEAPDRASDILNKLNEHGELTIAATPILGLLVQGVYLTGFFVYKKEIFSDAAREMVAEWGRPELSRYTSTHRPNFMLSNEVCHDAIFVWLYHEKAQEHLIEWARRRRSYHYLGMSCPIAALLGLPLGALFNGYYDQLTSWQPVSRFWLVIIMTFIWVGPAIWLAVRMWKDANQMEAAWAAFTLRKGRDETGPTQPSPSTPQPAV